MTPFVVVEAIRFLLEKLRGTYWLKRVYNAGVCGVAQEARVKPI
jgi:hypothetical protein